MWAEKLRKSILPSPPPNALGQVCTVIAVAVIEVDYGKVFKSPIQLALNTLYVKLVSAPLSTSWFGLAKAPLLDSSKELPDLE